MEHVANPTDADPLRLLNQPRVIAEVIGGILLGPSVMMRIPGFKNGICISVRFCVSLFY